MLKIKKEVFTEITCEFLSEKDETGFLLGTASRLNRLEYCYQLPAKQAGLHYYIPDEDEANNIIQYWAEQNVCFCGLIHSHVVPKEELSEADIEYAKLLFQTYHLPVLWFGIGIVKKTEVKFKFYAVNQNQDEKIEITEVAFNEFARKSWKK